MNKLIGVCLVFFAFVLLGCEKDEITYVTNDDLLNKNNITDVIFIFTQRNVCDCTLTIYHGNRGGKDWFALFDVNSGLLQGEWYGEKWNYNETLFPMMSGESLFSELENDEYAYLCTFPDGRNQIVYLLKGEKVKYGFIWPQNKSFRRMIGGKYLECFDHFLYYDLYDFNGNLIVKNCTSKDSLYTGFVDDKVWIGFYDEENNFKEIIGEEKFERNRKIHVGYGEYDEFYINYIQIGDWIKTKRGYAFLPCYNDERKQMDVFLICDDKLIFVPLPHYSGRFSNWYEESIIVMGKYILSLNGKEITEFPRSIAKKEKYEYEPISYGETVGFGGYNYWSDSDFSKIYRHDFVKDNDVWSTKIEKLSGVSNDAKKTMKILEKKGAIWTYRCNIVYINGSKSQFDFIIDINTGELNYI